MKRIEEAISFLPDRINYILNNIRTDIIENISEIRIRKDCPIVIKYDGKQFYLDENSNLLFKSNGHLPLVSEKEVEQSFVRLCEYSVYSHADDIKNGFITLKGGHRVGFSATAVREGEKIISVKKVSSLNIRIACEYIGCSKELFETMLHNGFGNVLIAGEPSSGKTTFLRDLARNLSEQGLNVSVIDERQELFGDDTDFQKGHCLDLYSSYPKHLAVQCAIRTMNPDYVVTDEIGDERECKAIIDGINCGVDFAMSIHCKNIDELNSKEIFRRIDSAKKFDYIVFLKGKNDAGTISEIIKANER